MAGLDGGPKYTGVKELCTSKPTIKRVTMFLKYFSPCPFSKNMNENKTKQGEYSTERLRRGVGNFIKL